ncbi:MAG: hypothetical protein FWE06_00420 [Oscillospiraceae bacterium]|nr:hypothetical protein [Oscillospiraceae bacterium]
MKATLLLSDKTRFQGEAFGSPGVAIGHICCHDGSYMPPLGDPAYANQLLLLNTPLVGVYGVNTEHCEAGKPFLSGLIVNDVCDTPSHWRSAETLDYYLRRHYVTAIKGIDTQALQTHLNEHGAMRAAICATPGFSGWQALHAKLNDHTMRGAYPGAVKHATPYEAHGPSRGHIGVVDLGSSRTLVRQLCLQGFDVKLLPPLGNWAADNYDAIVISHGAREDGHDVGLIDKIRQCQKPILAVGNGFSLLCAALDLPLEAIGLGVHSDDFATLDVSAGRMYGNAHNHRLSLPECLLADRSDLIVTHRTSDGLCAGLQHKDKPIWGVQFTGYIPPAWVAATDKS